MPGELSPPTGILYRIGRAPHPLDLPPMDVVGSGRFDDPRATPEYRVLYAGERLACFYECLAGFRVDLVGIASQGVTSEWLDRRRIASFRVQRATERHQWLDLTSPETYFAFRTIFSAQLRLLRLSDFDVSAATSEKRELTQTIGRWAYERRYAGIRYITRHAPRFQCWAVFEGQPIDVLDPGSAITLADPDLQMVARQWQLPLPWE